MAKRLVLFLLTNILVVVTVSIILSVLGVGTYIGPRGLDIGSLAIFCFIWGMAGAFISLQMSRWMAKRMTGAHVIQGQVRRSDWAQYCAALARLRPIGRVWVLFNFYSPDQPLETSYLDTIARRAGPEFDGRGAHAILYDFNAPPPPSDGGPPSP